MATIRGKIKLIGLRIISWELEKELPVMVFNSGVFCVDGFSGWLGLTLLSAKSERDLRKLFLYAKFGAAIKYFPKMYNLHIVLRYKEEKEEFSVKSKYAYKSNSFHYYEIAEIKVKDLLEITCTFLNVEREDKNDTYTEYCKDKDVSGNLVVKKNEEKRIKTEGTESIKNKGVTALIKSLTDVFLDEEYSDVILKVGEEKYPAHKVIITARSSVFKAMFKHDMKEKTEGEIDIEDCDPQLFRDFLRYIYTGTLDNIANENVFELYHMADKYDIKELRMECVDFIWNNLTTDIICDAISLCAKHGERELLTRATAFFIENAKVIVTTVNWQKFVKENPVEANELFIKTLNADHSK